MSGEVDFELAHPDDHHSGPSDHDDVLDNGRPPSRSRWSPGRIPEAAWVVLAGLVVAGFVVGYLVAPHSGGRSPAATTTVTVHIDASAEALNRLVARVESPYRLGDDERPAPNVPACPTIPTKGDPVRTMMTALTQQLSGFAARDAANTIDADQTLCAVEVRARDDLGATVVMTAEAPPNVAAPDFSASSSPETGTTARDVVAVVDGWRVEIGWMGPTAAAPAPQKLLAIAHDPTLRW
ncbi:MAG: hypothetical protein JO147_02380 [Actinobacteria bacterium]|nr:hypothetical protein [Actinomycetota bacterium]